jgi:TM2 domain-containing membrane protein YozV
MPKFCPNCGANLPNPDIKFCNEFGTQIIYPSPVDSKKPDHVQSEEKIQWVAALCSFFIPGLGQVYNGDTAKGIAVFFGTLMGFFIYFIPGLLVWLFGLYDAYITAKKMNTGEIPFRPTKTAHMILFFILGIIITAVVVFLVFLFVLANIFGPVAMHSVR